MPMAAADTQDEFPPKPGADSACSREETDALELEIHSGDKLFECFKRNLCAAEEARDQARVHKAEQAVKADLAMTLCQQIQMQRDFDVSLKDLLDLRNDAMGSPTPNEIDQEVWLEQLWCQSLHNEPVVNVACRRDRSKVMHLCSASLEGIAVVQEMDLDEYTTKPDADDAIGFMLEPSGGAFLSAAFVDCPDHSRGWLLATGNRLGDIRVWDVDISGECQCDVSVGHGNAITCLASTPSNVLLGAAGDTVHVLDLYSESEPVRTLMHQGIVFGMRAPEHQLVASFCEEEESPCCLSLWDLRVERRICQLASELKGPGPPSFDVCGSGPSILIAGTQGTGFEAWDLRRAPRPLCLCPNLVSAPECHIIALAIEPANELVAVSCIEPENRNTEHGNVFVGSLSSICRGSSESMKPLLDSDSKSTQSLVWCSVPEAKHLLFMGDTTGCVRAASAELREPETSGLGAVWC